MISCSAVIFANTRVETQIPFVLLAQELSQWWILNTFCEWCGWETLTVQFLQGAGSTGGWCLTPKQDFCRIVVPVARCPAAGKIPVWSVLLFGVLFCVFYGWEVAARAVVVGEVSQAVKWVSMIAEDPRTDVHGLNRYPLHWLKILGRVVACCFMEV